MTNINPNELSKALELTQEALYEFEKPTFRLSTVIQKAVRIARLRNDYENLCWLSLEMVAFDDKVAKAHVAREIRPHFSQDKFDAMYRSIIISIIEERRCDKSLNDRGEVIDVENVFSRSIPEIETAIDLLIDDLQKSAPPLGLHPIDLYHAQQSYANTRMANTTLIGEWSAILQRIKRKVYDFLSVSEKQLMYSQIGTDVFERNRQRVDAQLRIIAPEVLEKFVSAYQRLGENTSESRSQALLSCRRILKSLADRLYPPSHELVVGVDGKKRKITDDMYINRLWQFVTEKVGGTASGDLLLAQVEALGHRIDRLNDLSSKGVHAEVSEREVDQCVIQTYLLIGDILYVVEQDSANTP